LFSADGQSDVTKALVNILNSANVPKFTEFCLPRFKEGIISDTQAVFENSKE